MKVLSIIIVLMVSYGIYVTNAESKIPEPYVVKTGVVIESGCATFNPGKYSYTDCRAKIKFGDETIKKSLKFSVLKGDEIEYMQSDFYEIPFSKDWEAYNYFRLKK